MKRKISLFLLALFGFSGFSSTASAAVFPADITFHKYRSDIEFMYVNNFVTGYPNGTFKAHKPVNRAEYVKMIVLAANVQPTLEENNHCFPDVTVQWFAPYVCYAKSQGWIHGYTDNTFQPRRSVNRAEAVKMLMTSRDYSFSIGYIRDEFFADVDRKAWYAPFVKYAQERGIFDEYTTEFGPSMLLTRGAASHLIYRTIWSENPENMVDVEVETETPVRPYTVTELGTEEIVVGPGEEVKLGDKIQVHYTGKLSDGTVFDSTVERADPFEFVLGNDSIIKGFNIGIQGMRVGGKRKIIVPASLGYGNADVGGRIPPGSTLYFEVEVVKIVK